MRHPLQHVIGDQEHKVAVVDCQTSVLRGLASLRWRQIRLACSSGGAQGSYAAGLQAGGLAEVGDSMSCSSSARHFACLNPVCLISSRCRSTSKRPANACVAPSGRMKSPFSRMPRPRSALADFGVHGLHILLAAQVVERPGGDHSIDRSIDDVLPVVPDEVGLQVGDARRIPVQPCARCPAWEWKIDAAVADGRHGLQDMLRQVPGTDTKLDDTPIRRNGGAARQAPARTVQGAAPSG